MSENVKLLYVDDEEINLELFSIVFNTKFNVITTKSGYEGLGILEDNQDVSVVISDMKMPGLNGIEFIKIAKDKYKNIVYFILTGFEITDEISDALASKLINKYFKKPFNSKEIELSISEALGIV